MVLDLWWSPAAELAIDRTHSIGQDKSVTVYRLVSADTTAERVVALQRHATCSSRWWALTSTSRPR